MTMAHFYDNPPLNNLQHDYLFVRKPEMQLGETLFQDLSSHLECIIFLVPNGTS